MTTSRRQFLTLAGGGLLSALITRDVLALGSQRVAPDKLVVHLSPSCGCCAKWVDHMRRAGFEVELHHMNDVDPVKKEHNVPQKLWSCHTGLVGGYAIEGHVPAPVVQRLLRERPAVAGVAVAGMPMGSPGMEHGEHKEPFDVVSFTCCGDIKVFAKG